MEEGSRSERIMSEETGRSALSPFAPPEIAKRRNSASKDVVSVPQNEEAICDPNNATKIIENCADDDGDSQSNGNPVVQVAQQSQSDPSAAATDIKEEVEEHETERGIEEVQEREQQEQDLGEQTEKEGQTEGEVEEVATKVKNEEDEATINSSSMLLSALTFHPESPPSLCMTIETILSTSMLIKEGRLSFKSEDVLSSSSTSLWPSSLSMSSSSSSKLSSIDKDLHLFSDAILVTVPQEDGSNLFEEYIDMSATRVQVRCDDYNDMLQQQEGEFVDLFELIYGASCLEIKAKSKEERDDWIANLVETLQDHVPEDEKLIGWKHQVRLGTIHSAVMLRDTLLIERCKEHCEEGLMEYMIFDLADDDGLTPFL